MSGLWEAIGGLCPSEEIKLATPLKNINKILNYNLLVYQTLFFLFINFVIGFFFKEPKNFLDISNSHFSDGGNWGQKNSCLNRSTDERVEI